MAGSRDGFLCCICPLPLEILSHLVAEAFDMEEHIGSGTILVSLD